ncbi:hypothetical protein ACOI1C_20545 [Bacillus sp. DJP31]|uniref:hypothetical protein n=1 Tax=Bacillus sp. DJP31 TaxID=3409789 RepID=UPI003BB794FF
MVDRSSGQPFFDLIADSYNRIDIMKKYTIEQLIVLEEQLRTYITPVPIHLILIMEVNNNSK